MVKKISYIIISVAILVAGYFALSKLNYWERSARIFSISSDKPFEGRMGRSPGGFEGRARLGAEGGRPIMRDRNIPDSLRQQFRRNDGERMEGGRFEGRMRGGEGRGRSEFPGGKKINLRNVVWFLAVFASSTALVIYIDKACCLIKKRRNGAMAQRHNGI
jgi:hypothetical protein